MSLLKLFRSQRAKGASASIAKERLQIIVSHERSSKSTPDFFPKLQPRERPQINENSAKLCSRMYEL